MNIGEKVTLYFYDDQRPVERGDLFRVTDIEDETGQITLTAIDYACLRPDEIGEYRKDERTRKPSRYGVKGKPRPAQFLPREKEKEK